MKICLFSLLFALMLPSIAISETSPEIAIKWSEIIPENEFNHKFTSYPPPEDHDIIDGTSFNKEQLKDYYLKLSEEQQTRIYFKDENFDELDMQFDELATKKPRWIVLRKNDDTIARFKLRGEHYYLLGNKTTLDFTLREWIPFSKEQLEDYCLNFPVIKVKTHIYFVDKDFKQLDMQFNELATKKPAWIFMRKDTAPAAVFKLSGEHYKFIDTKTTRLLKAYLLNFGTVKAKNYNFSSNDYQYFYYFINDANKGDSYPNHLIEKNELRHVIYYSQGIEEDITCVCYRFLPQYRALVKVPIPKAAMLCFENELSFQRHMLDVVNKLEEGLKKKTMEYVIDKNGKLLPIITSSSAIISEPLK